MEEIRDKNGLTEEEFLAAYDPDKYKKPAVTVDMMVLRMKEDLSSMQILLIKRKGHPFINHWALPGGFVEMDESAYSAACRELREETGLTDVYLEQVYTMTQPGRDPRMRIIDIAYMALIPYGKELAIHAGDDARDVAWFDVSFADTLKFVGNNITIEYRLTEKNFKNGVLNVTNFVPELITVEALAFDHAEVVLEGLMKLRRESVIIDTAFNLAPEIFTLPDLQRIYELIQGKVLYKTNFRDSIKSKVLETDESGRSISGGKTSKLYRYLNESDNR